MWKNKQLSLNPGQSGLERLCVEEREWHFKPRRRGGVVYCELGRRDYLQNCSFSPKFETDNLD